MQEIIAAFGGLQNAAGMSEDALRKYLAN